MVCFCKLSLRFQKLENMSRQENKTRNQIAYIPNMSFTILESISQF